MAAKPQGISSEPVVVKEGEVLQISGVTFNAPVTIHIEGVTTKGAFLYRLRLAMSLLLNSSPLFSRESVTIR